MAKNAVIYSRVDWLQYVGRIRGGLHSNCKDGVSSGQAYTGNMDALDECRFGGPHTKNCIFLGSPYL